MPKWELHNKWAKRLGISRDVSDYVNRLIDFPKRCPDFKEFAEDEDNWKDFYKLMHAYWPAYCRRQIRHDAGRSNVATTYIQLKFLSQKGSDYIKAWYLHHLLDEVERRLRSLRKRYRNVSYYETLVRNPWFSLDAAVEKLRRVVRPVVGSCEEFRIVEDFLEDNWIELLQDFRYLIASQSS